MTDPSTDEPALVSGSLADTTPCSRFQSMNIKDLVGMLTMAIGLTAGLLGALRLRAAAIALAIVVLLFFLIYPAAMLFPYNAALHFTQPLVGPFRPRTHIGIEDVFRAQHARLKSEVRTALRLHEQEMRSTLPKELEIPNVQGSWLFQPVKRGARLLGTRYFPVLSEIVGRFPAVIHCSISRVGPRARIPPHLGYFRGVYRLLYPLIVPDPALEGRVHLTVRGQRHTFREGVPCVFDDNYEHTVVNETDEARVAIYLDIERPLANRALACVNRGVIRLANAYIDAEENDG